MKRFAYILSPSYSGSTLLTILLARHPQIATIGELKATHMGEIAEYVCSCGTRIVECDFWQQVADGLAQRGIEFDLADFGTAFRRPARPMLDRVLRARVRGAGFESVRRLALQTLPGAARTFEEILERNRALAEVVTELQGADVFLDGSKEPQRLKYLIEAGFPDIRVIHLVRDGRAVANSTIKHDACSVASAAQEWRRMHEESQRVLRRLPEAAYATVRYEDLCLRPDEILPDLFRLVGVDPQTPQRAATEPHHILGNSMRLKPLREIRLDEKWHDELSADQLAEFDGLAGEVNRGYGYA